MVHLVNVRKSKDGNGNGMLVISNKNRATIQLQNCTALVVTLVLISIKKERERKREIQKALGRSSATLIFIRLFVPPKKKRKDGEKVLRWRQLEMRNSLLLLLMMYLFWWSLMKWWWWLYQCWVCLQNGTIEEVKRIVSMLNEAEVPSEEIVGMIKKSPFGFDVLFSFFNLISLWFSVYLNHE